MGREKGAIQETLEFTDLDAAPALSPTGSRHRCGPRPRGVEPTATPEPTARGRLVDAGPEALSDHELLALVLGGPADEVLPRCGGLFGLARSSVHDLLDVAGIGEAKACKVLAAVELGRRVAGVRSPGRPVISSPKDVDALLRGRIAHLDQEHFVVLLLNTKNEVMGSPTVSIGTLSSSLVHPREVFKPAVRASAANVILAHNHPSGHVRPSREDHTVTKRLADAGSIFGIEVLDHVILGDVYHSMKEHGTL